jgi:hypothetical protein
VRYLARLQAEAPGQEPLDYALFANLNSVVAAGNFDKQHGKSEGGIVLFAGLTAVIDTPQKGKQSIEHGQFLEAETRNFGASTGLFETMRITHSNARVNRGIVLDFDATAVPVHGQSHGRSERDPNRLVPP